MRLLEIVQKSDDGDFLKTIAETALQRIMDADVENIIGAARHERSPERLTYRNGYRERTLEGRVANSVVGCSAGGIGPVFRFY